MVLLRRLTLIGAIVFTGSMALAAAGLAAGGGQSSSEFTFKDLSASATFGGLKGAPPDQLGFFLFVSRSSQSFEVGGSGSSEKTIEQTDVSINLFSSTVNEAGCFVVPESDFKIDRNLQSASLNTTITDANAQCPGKGGLAAGASGGSPKAGGGGTQPPPPPGPLTLPITVHMTWSGNGVVATSRSSNSFDCLDYHTSFEDTSRSSVADASGTISVLSAPFDTPSANVGSDLSTQETKSAPPPACFGV